MIKFILFKKWPKRLLYC